MSMANRRFQIRANILKENQKTLKTVTLDDKQLLKLEALLSNKISNKFANVFIGLKKTFSQFDVDKSGTLDLAEFGKLVGCFINGVKQEEINALVRMYDYEEAGVVKNADFLQRMLGEDAGVKVHRRAIRESETTRGRGQVWLSSCAMIEGRFATF